MHYSSSKELVSGMYVPCTILDWLHICTHTHTQFVPVKLCQSWEVVVMTIAYTCEV